MSDYWGNRYFSAKYFSKRYFGSTAGTAEGFLSAVLRGTATLSAYAEGASFVSADVLGQGYLAAEACGAGNVAASLYGQGYLQATAGRPATSEMVAALFGYSTVIADLSAVGNVQEAGSLGARARANPQNGAASYRQISASITSSSRVIAKVSAAATAAAGIGGESRLRARGTVFRRYTPQDNNFWLMAA